MSDKDPLDELHGRVRDTADHFGAKPRGEVVQLLVELDDALVRLRGEPSHPFVERIPDGPLCQCGQPRYAPCHLTGAGLLIEA